MEVTVLMRPGVDQPDRYAMWDALHRAITVPFPKPGLNPQVQRRVHRCAGFRDLGTISYGAGCQPFGRPVRVRNAGSTVHDERVDVEVVRLTTELWERVVLGPPRLSLEVVAGAMDSTQHSTSSAPGRTEFSPTL